MSKLDQRNAIKSLSNLNYDCQYVYKIGLEIFNDKGENPQLIQSLCAEIETICNDLEIALKEIRKLGVSACNSE